ncbi:MAG: hypothetical protein LCH46_07225 [Proteobacteria bacterium]|nr:hypothetical protein [Pseudomonadota bacterium]
MTQALAAFEAVRVEILSSWCITDQALDAHPDIASLATRIHRLSADLDDDEMLQCNRIVAELDGQALFYRSILRHLEWTALPDPGPWCRPRRDEINSFMMFAGFVWRCRDYLDKLEAKHRRRAKAAA